MCHAQVNSNIISDFGFGDPFYFAGWNSEAGFYSNHLDSWQSAKVQGSLLVPAAATLKRSEFPIVDWVDPNGNTPEYKLSSVLQMNKGLGDPMSVGIMPAPGKEKVIEKSQIHIAAPTDLDIQALAALPQVGFKPLKIPGLPDPEIIGLEVVRGNNGRLYVRNIPGTPLVCSGDIAISGTLFLNAPQIRTTRPGCRLYVAGSVFTRGKITLSDKDPGASLTTHNLQISSSRIIALGFSAESIHQRLVKFRSETRAVHKQFWNVDSLAFDATAIPDADLVDATQDPGGREIPMSRLLLNAPHVHSRYQGAFTGAIVAEIAIFSLGQFAFSFDPIFQDEAVPILPAHKIEILEVKD